MDEGEDNVDKDGVFYLTLHKFVQNRMKKLTTVVLSSVYGVLFWCFLFSVDGNKRKKPRTNR